MKLVENALLSGDCTENHSQIEPTLSGAQLKQQRGRLVPSDASLCGGLIAPRTVRANDSGVACMQILFSAGKSSIE